MKLPFELADDWRIEDVLDLTAPPMLAFHIVADDGRVTTHHRAFNA